MSLTADELAQLAGLGQAGYAKLEAEGNRLLDSMLKTLSVPMGGNVFIANALASFAVIEEGAGGAFTMALTLAAAMERLRKQMNEKPE